MHHQKLDRWFQLRGHCDGNSDVLAVAIRETIEESGICGIQPVSLQIYDLDIHTIPKNSQDPSHDHYDVRFLLKTIDSDQYQKNEESKDLRWFRFDEDFPSELVRTPSLNWMIKKFKNFSI
jgi:hypothetical protein